MNKQIEEITAAGFEVCIFRIAGGWYGVEVSDNENPSFFGRGDTLENAVLGAYNDWKSRLSK